MAIAFARFPFMIKSPHDDADVHIPLDVSGIIQLSQRCFLHEQIYVFLQRQARFLFNKRQLMGHFFLFDLVIHHMAGGKLL